MSQIVSDACRHGTVNAIELAKFREVCEQLEEKREHFLIEAYKSLFVIPSDADREREILCYAVRALAKEWRQ